MEYIQYKMVTPEHSLLWLCGRPTQLTNYLLNYLKHTILPEAFDKDGKLLTYKENVITLNSTTCSATLDDIFKEPPFLGSHYILVGDYSDLDNRTRRHLLNLLQNKPDFIVSLVYISKYRDYKQLADNKTFNIGKSIYLFRIPRELYKDYARAYTQLEISDKALNSYIKRTSTYDNFMLYLDKLSTLPSPVTAEVLRKSIPDCTGYTMLDYLRTLILRDKKTVHMKALNNCISAYGRKTYAELMNNLEVLLSLKQLTLQGYILPVNLETDIEYLDSKHMLPEVVMNMSIYKLRNYLDITANISLSELNLIYVSFLNIKPTTQNLFILTDIVYNREEARELLGSICSRQLLLE